jgi:hypothetical protein
MLLRSAWLLFSLELVRKFCIPEAYYSTDFGVLLFLRPSDLLFLQRMLHFTGNNASIACKQRSYDYNAMPLRVGQSYTSHTGEAIR